MTNRTGQIRLSILVIVLWLCSLGLYKFHQTDSGSWVTSQARKQFDETFATFKHNNVDYTEHDIVPSHHHQPTPEDTRRPEQHDSDTHTWPQPVRQAYDSNSPIHISNDQIVIVQHFHNSDEMHMKSLENHKKYAETHGYRYRPDTTQYIEEDRKWNAKTLNKAYAIMSAMLKEMQDGDEGAKWMFFADGGDTFFYNPSIPLAAYLPPSHITPEPYIMGSQDWNGFNAGVLLLRINQRMASFFAQILGTPNTHPMLEGQDESWEASDQWIMGTLLNQGRTDSKNHVADHFYNIPKVWLNSYGLHEDEGNVGEWESVPPNPHMETDPETGEEKMVGEEWSAEFHPGWQPRCHVHFPAQNFFDLEELYQNVDEIYKLGLEAGNNGTGVIITEMERDGEGSSTSASKQRLRAGLKSLGYGEKAAKVARDWWETESKAGLEDVKFFLDEGDRPSGIAVR